MVNEIERRALRPLAGDQQQIACLARLERADGGAGAVDDVMHAAALPDGERPPFADHDVELVRVDAVDARALDPVDVLHHAPGPPGIEADERAAELDADRRPHPLPPG